MKRYLPFVFLTLIICWRSLPTVNDTIVKPIEPVMIEYDTLPQKIVDSTVILKRKNDSLRKVKNQLFKEEVKLQQQLAAKKTDTVIIYVGDSVKKKDALPLNADHIKHKKQFFLFRLFHHKKCKK